MRTFLVFLLFFALSSSAGELGLRLATPHSAWGWMTQEWRLWNLGGSARVEVDLLPLEFRRVLLSFQLPTTLGTWKTEGVFLPPGRIDLFFSAAISQSFSVAFADVQAAGGGKWGWAAANLAPTWIETLWALLQLEMPFLVWKLEIEGPPFTLSLSTKCSGVFLFLGSAFLLELSKTSGDLSLSTQIQVAPQKMQKITVLWAGVNGTFQGWLTPAGAGFLLSHTIGDLSLVCTFSFGPSPGGTLEVTRIF